MKRLKLDSDKTHVMILDKPHFLSSESINFAIHDEGVDYIDVTDLGAVISHTGSNVEIIWGTCPNPDVLGYILIKSIFKILEIRK